VEEMKIQIPKSRVQESSKFQAPRPAGGRYLDFGPWNFLGFWNLDFGFFAA
jgi:hypothetical protein